MTYCNSTQCEKRHLCAKHGMNIKEDSDYFAIDYSSYGSGKCTEQGCEIDHWCGELGDYKRFEPIKYTQFDRFKPMNINELAEWIDKNGQFDGSPWMKWFDENYCSRCQPIMCKYEDSTYEFPCSWCELNDKKCKFFPELGEAPDNKKIIKMWLETEVEE